MMAADTASDAGTTTTSEPLHTNGQSQLDEIVAEHDAVLTDVYADWCGPCQIPEPIVERLAAETDAAVAKLDIDANQQLAGAYGVRGVTTPTLSPTASESKRSSGCRVNGNCTLWSGGTPSN